MVTAKPKDNTGFLGISVENRQEFERGIDNDG
jgi:hypothetical protein